MRMLLGREKHTQFVCVVILLNLLLIGNVHSQTNQGGGAIHRNLGEISKVSSVKKALKEMPPLPDEVKPEVNNDQNEKVVKTTEKKEPERNLSNGKQNNEQRSTAKPPLPQKETNKTGGTQNPQSSSTDNKTSTLTQSSSSAATSPSSPFMYHRGETILNSNEDISDSLKTGFYFFAAVSLSAIAFIICKVYRLRLSRAERRYGVQGDRSTQELTPLPIAIDDGPSDEEDQTLFDVQRQNIRIL